MADNKSIIVEDQYLWPIEYLANSANHLTCWVPLEENSWETSPITNELLVSAVRDYCILSILEKNEGKNRVRRRM
jgi:hypothetical protein